jgi:hypothetical protein
MRTLLTLALSLSLTGCVEKAAQDTALPTPGDESDADTDADADADADSDADSDADADADADSDAAKAEAFAASPPKSSRSHRRGLRHGNDSPKTRRSGGFPKGGHCGLARGAAMRRAKPARRPPLAGDARGPAGPLPGGLGAGGPRHRGKDRAAARKAPSLSDQAAPSGENPFDAVAPGGKTTGWRQPKKRRRPDGATGRASGR